MPGPLRPTASTVLGTARAMAVVGVLVVGLGGAALWLRISPPEDRVATATTAALGCLAGLILVVALGRHSRGPGRGGALESPGIVVAVGAVCVVLVDGVRSVAGLSGPWPQQELLAVAVVAGAALWWGARGAVSLSLLFVGLLVAPRMLGTTDRSLTVTVVTSVVAGVQLVLVGLGLAALAAIAARLADAWDAATTSRADALLELEVARSAASAAAETQRSLHDTALNTLEAIAGSQPDVPPTAVVARCRRDIEVLTSAVAPPGPELAAALRSVAGEAAALGVDVDCRFAPETPWDAVPNDLGAAVVGAVREALVNVAKHSGADRAELVVTRDAGVGIRVTVSDLGVGRPAAGRSEDPPGGFGIGESLVRRMTEAGGLARVEDGPEGVGTVVTLTWSPQVHQGLSRPAGAWRAPFSQLVLLATWAVTLVSLVTGGLAMASFAAPVPALVAVLLPAVWVTVLALRVQAGSDIGIADVVTSGLVLAAATILPVAADPYCASVVGERGLPSARLILLVALLVWRPRASTWALAAAALVLSGGLAAWLRHRRWPDCGVQSLALTVAELAVVTLVYVGVRVLSRRAGELSRLEDEALTARLDVQREQARAAERRRWSDALVSAAVDELSSVARSGGVVDAATRQRAGSLAGLLRALLAVGPAPDPLHSTLRQWLSARLGDIARAGPVAMEVRGSVARLRPPPAVVDVVASCLHRLGDLAPSSLVLVGWSEHATQGLSLRAVAATTSWLPPVHREEGWECDPDAEDDTAGDVAWTWTVPAAATSGSDRPTGDRVGPPVPSRLRVGKQPKELG